MLPMPHPSDSTWKTEPPNFSARASFPRGPVVELPRSHRVPAVRAELLARLGERAAALEAFDEALGLCQNVAETSHLERRRADVVGS